MKPRALQRCGVNVGAVGLGAMHLSLSGRPDEQTAEQTLAEALDAGVTLIDTADAYCVDHRDIGHNERLIGKFLRGHHHNNVFIATKGGLTRPNGAWHRDARPEHLLQACDASLKALGVDVIDLYQLHAPDPEVPFSESVGTLAKLRQQGKIKHVGLSNVTAAQIEEADQIVPIVSVQNRWNPGHRNPERDGVLALCQQKGIAFLPYSPFGGASGAKTLAGTGSLAQEAAKRGISPHKLVLAWMLAKSPVVIPIPGARRPQSIRDSAAAADMELSSDDIATVEKAIAG